MTGESRTFPPSAELKLRARGVMGRSYGACTALGAAVAVMCLLIDWFQQNSGGALLLYYWDAAANDIPNSFSLSAQGLFAAMRVEEYGVGLSLAVTPAVLRTFLLARLAAAVVTAPFKMGCLDNLCRIRQGQPRPFRAVFGWYADLRRTGQAVLLEVVLWLIQLVTEAVLLTPALLVLARSGGELSRISAAMWLVVLGQGAAWCVMTQWTPARYLLARDGKGVGSALRTGQAVLRGRRMKYLLFRLSFVIWNVLNSLSRGLFNLYLYSYQGLAELEWLAEVESAAGNEMQSSPF